MHIMLDLETWGTRAGFDIRSVGAVVFDPISGAVCGYNDVNLPGIKTFYIACNNPTPIGYEPTYEQEWEHPRKYPLTRDPRTVQWWNDQSEEARGAFSNPVDLREALQKFAGWLITATFDERHNADALVIPSVDKWTGLHIWAHGPQFDISILEAAYHAVGLPVPWHYRAPRDTRTAFDMAGVGDHSTWLQQFNHGTAHNALDDAISQARAVCAAWAKVTERRTTYDAVMIPQIELAVRNELFRQRRENLQMPYVDDGDDCLILDGGFDINALAKAIFTAEYRQP